jgi:hypothetical protein
VETKSSLHWTGISHKYTMKKRKNRERGVMQRS